MKNDLTQGKPAEHLLALTLPGVWGALAVMLMNLADTWFIGRLGGDALAAISFTFPVVMIISSIALGMGTAAISLITRAIGSEQVELVVAYCTHSLLMTLCIGALFALTGLFTIEPLFKLLGAPERLLPLIRDYMTVWYLSSVLIIITLVSNAIIRASGNTRFPGMVLIGIALLNFSMTPVLIFGLLGFPALGLTGAALATSLAFCSGLIAVVYYIFRKLEWLYPKIIYQDIKRYWKAIFVIALPNTASSLLTPITVAITVSFIAQYGSGAVAGYGVASRVSALGIIILAALSTTLAVFAGQHQGARKMERMDAALKLSFGFSIIWGILLAIVFWLFAPAIISLFTDQTLAIESASHYLYIIPVSFVFLGIIMISSAVSNGVGEPTPALLFKVTRLLILYLPLVWLLSKGFGLNGVYAAAAISNVCVGIVAYHWIKQKAERGRSIRETAAARKAAWDERYYTDDYLFGTEPNTFLVEHALQLPVGDTLSIGEGEGRNATFLADQGHRVTALDASKVALNKARKLAASKQLTIHTLHEDLNSYKFATEQWDTIVSIFCHLPETMRKRVYLSLVNALKPGGYLILEAFTPEQLAFKTGGPPTLNMLVDLKTLKKELDGLAFIHASESYRELKEGRGHDGYGAVVQILARKPTQ